MGGSLDGTADFVNALKKARVYGLANGSSLIVESDDDFKAWEAEHIIPSVPAGQ